MDYSAKESLNLRNNCLHDDRLSKSAVLAGRPFVSELGGLHAAGVQLRSIGSWVHETALKLLGVTLLHCIVVVNLLSRVVSVDRL